MASEALAAVSLGFAGAGGIALVASLGIDFRKGRLSLTRERHGALDLVGASSTLLGLAVALGVGVALVASSAFETDLWLLSLYTALVPFLVVIGLFVGVARRRATGKVRFPVGGDWIPVMTRRRWAIAVSTLGALVALAFATLVWRWAEVSAGPVRGLGLQAWQGWIGSVFGAVLGAAVSVFVAVMVLRKTLTHERTQFLQQLEAQRDLTIEDRRNAAWTELIARLRASEWTEVPGFDSFAYRHQLQAAFHQWSLFVPPDSDHIAEAVDGVLSHMLAYIEDAREQVWQHVEADNSSNGSLRVTSAAATALLGELVMHGKSWHRKDRGLEDAEVWFAQFRNSK